MVPCPPERYQYYWKDNVQRRAAKLILDLSPLSYKHKLERTGSISLEICRLRTDLTEVFKNVKELENVDWAVCFVSIYQKIVEQEVISQNSRSTSVSSASFLNPVRLRHPIKDISAPRTCREVGLTLGELQVCRLDIRKYPFSQHTASSLNGTNCHRRLILPQKSTDLRRWSILFCGKGGGCTELRLIHTNPYGPWFMLPVSF